MRVLVVGASGFVGSHLCRYLAGKDHDVLAGVRLPGTAAPFDEIRIGDLSSLDGDVDFGGCRAVVHLAARVHVMHDTSRDPLAEFRRVNTAGTERLAATAAAAGVRRFVYASTIKVLGERTGERPFRHGDPAAPADPYAVSKYEAEQALARLAADTGMEVVILRPPLVYGPRVGGNVLRAMRLVRRRLPLPVAMLNNRRSMLGVTNLCEAIARALAIDAAPTEPLLLADGEDLSTRQFFELIGRAMGAPVRLLPVPAALLRAAGALVGRSGAVARLTESLEVDASRTRELLDWTPPLSVEQEMAETVRCFLESEQ